MANRRFRCPACDKPQMVGADALASGPHERVCPFCAKSMTVEDRGGALFVDGAEVEELHARPKPAEAAASGAPLPPGVTRESAEEAMLAPLPPGVKRSDLPTPKKKKKKVVEEAPAAEPEPPAPEPPPPPPALSGTLETVPLADVLMLLIKGQRSGSLAVQSDDGTAKLFITAGGIVGCRHPTPGINIGTFLVESGFIAQEQLDGAMTSIYAGPGGADLGAAPPTAASILLALIQTGALNEGQSQTAVGQFVDNTVAHLLAWTAGSFTFEPYVDNPSAGDLMDPQAAFAVTALAPPHRLESAARFVVPPPVMAPEPPPPAPMPELPSEPSPEELEAAKPRASKKWGWLIVPGILLGLGAGGFFAYKFQQESITCASALADAQTELAKPPNCPPPECPAPPPCEGSATQGEDGGGEKATESRRKGKRSRRKGKGKRGQESKPGRDSSGTSAPSIDDLMN